MTTPKTVVKMSKYHAGTWINPKYEPLIIETTNLFFHNFGFASGLDLVAGLKAFRKRVPKYEANRICCSAPQNM